MIIPAETMTNGTQVVEVVGSLGDGFCISTDSRGIDKKCAFVALDGPNHKGSDFAQDCLKKGVKVLVLNENYRQVVSRLEKQYSFAVIYVKDTLKYLQELATVVSGKWQDRGGILIGITGSNGKTTNKEMLYHILSSIFPHQVSATVGNLNNHIGVPLTILSIDSDCKVAVVEMGTNHPGEMKVLCNIASPFSGFITNIGDAHLEFFGDREGVFAEKSVLYQAIKQKQGPYIINQDDEKLRILQKSNNTISYGRLGDDVKIEFVDNGLILKFKEDKFVVNNPRLSGTFNYFNLGMCMTLVMSLFPDKKNEIIEAAESFDPPQNNRTSWIERKGKRVFLDAYNANPSSMLASLTSFIKDQDIGKSLFVLGDMNELGEKAEELHGQVGEFLRKKGIKNVIFVGRYCDFYKNAFGEGGQTYGSVDSLAEDWLSHFNKYKTIFIKGSRSLQLERLLDNI